MRITTMKKFLSSLLLKFNHRILKTDTVMFFEPLLQKHLQHQPDFFFVQVGANDGIFCCSLFELVTKNRLRGLVVEPLNDLFAQLKKNYAPFPQVKPVHCAIHTSLKSVQIHRVDPAQQHRVGDFAKGIGLLDRTHRQRAGVPDDCMISETVPAMKLTEFLKNNSVTRVDFLIGRGYYLIMETHDAIAYDREIFAERAV
jgi:FkbM family methyltransferase